MYSVQCTVYSVRCTLNSVHHTLYVVLCRRKDKELKLHSLFYQLCNYLKKKERTKLIPNEIIISVPVVAIIIIIVVTVIIK